MTPWVGRIIAANAAMFLLSAASPDVYRALMFVPAEALLSPWTAFTYMFLHAGLGHIFFNMLSLFFFGPRLEVELGARNFLVLYLLSGLAGAGLSFVFSFNTAVVGASAAVYGVFLGYTWFWPRAEIYIWGVLPVQAWVLVVVMTLLSLLGVFGGGDGIAHFAHLGGFLGAFLYLRYTAAGRRAGVPSPAKPERLVVDPGSLQRWRNIPPESMHEVNREEYRRILAKMDAGGAGTLTPQEVAFLERFSSR